MTSSHETQLKEKIYRGKVVIVAGSGVSISASKNHPQASWAGLLKSGLAWVKERNLIATDIADAYTALLENNPKTHTFISAATDITHAMGGTHSTLLEQWLAPTIGQIKAKEQDLLDALNDLRKHGNLLATTNYDSLLLGDPPHLTPVTWQEEEFLTVVRDWDTEKILYLHGFWRDPQSVVLDWNSYDSIARDLDYRHRLTAVWETNTWLFVGCGRDGLSDPDFGLLLERYGKRAQQANRYDYCLVRGETERLEFDRHFKKLGFNIRAISYGENYPDLSKYLLSMLPPPPKPTPVGKVDTSKEGTSSAKAPEPAIPKAPAFFARPDYIGSHTFVGRKAELDALSDWANSADPTNLLLFEAIGGNGKSMLTWEWVTQYSEAVRADWAGRFWYSFYERGAYMQDFCQHALAYMTGRPLTDFKKLKTLQMRDQLIAELHDQPWLLILDGLERVLVAYHRFDAAQIPDEEANTPTDEILERNPCDAIRDEDTDLLRALAGCSPSKILISSRLTPRVLTNQAGQAIPGAQRLPLAGLRPADAEALLKSCGVRGESAAIRAYLQKNCGNHPLVIGILAGLINQPGPYRHDFDQWSTDPCGGAQLDLGELDLVQRRNHILNAAIKVLSNESRQVLSVLALLSESVDYQTIEALNPTELQEANSPSTGLVDTIRDLEQRGLLQFEGTDQKYDLHPVVRGVVAGEMGSVEKKRYGQSVVDYFSQQTQEPFEQAQTMEDLKIPLNIFRTLVKMDHFQHAADFFNSNLGNALLFNLEAHTEILSLLRPFFSSDWATLPSTGTNETSGILQNRLAIALGVLGHFEEATHCNEQLIKRRKEAKSWAALGITASNLSKFFLKENHIVKAKKFASILLQIAELVQRDSHIFHAHLLLFLLESEVGSWEKGEIHWNTLNPMGRTWHRNLYRQGDAESSFAWFQFNQGLLKEEDLAIGLSEAKKGNNRKAQRALYRLRGTWSLENERFQHAIDSFKTAVQMARERSLFDSDSETGLALAKLRLGQLNLEEARTEAERVTQFPKPSHRFLAMLWRDIGDEKKAKHHALEAYRWAWADGEPYVHRYELEKTKALFAEMNIPVPDLPVYDPAKETVYPWEADLQEAIEELRAEKEAEKKAEEEKESGQ